MKPTLSKLILLFILTIILHAHPVYAAKKKNKAIMDFTHSPKYAALIVNSETGEIIYHKNAKNQLHPASLTKLMTLYLTFQALENKVLTIHEKLPISLRAASMPKTNLRLKPGQQITTRDAILGLIIHSANDAAVVLAEAIAGSEEAFADKMVKTANALGMKETNFVNASGWHDNNQLTTAYDMAKLAIALRRDYSAYYPMFSIKSFRFNGRVINTHNRVMHRYPWADGLKTGFINASGFNLITSTNRHDGRLIGVVMGGSSAYARDSHMIQLLEYGYNKITPNNQMTAAVPSKSPIDKKKGVFELAQAEDASPAFINYQTDVFSSLVTQNSDEITLDASNAETNKTFGELTANHSKSVTTSYKGDKKIVKKHYAQLKNKPKKVTQKKAKKKVVVIKKKSQNNPSTVIQ